MFSCYSLVNLYFRMIGFSLSDFVNDAVVGVSNNFICESNEYGSEGECVMSV